MDNEYIYIGKIVNTHGIKGELRLLSDFKYKDKVFLENRKIYISEDYICETINTYRHHKIFDMITLKGYNNINQVLKYLNQTVYVKRNDLLLNDDEFLDKDIINLNIVFDNKEVGRVLAIKKGMHSLLVMKEMELVKMLWKSVMNFCILKQMK